MSDIQCHTCGQTIALADADESTVKAAVDNHKRFCTKHPRKDPVMPPVTALRPVPDQAPKRPHPRDLTNHPSKTVARAAQKVLEAVAKLDEAWEADAAKAELRAKRDRLKKQLATVEAELRGTPAKTMPRDWKQIRAWATEQNIDCPVTGKVPNVVVDAYDQAHSS